MSSTALRTAGEQRIVDILLAATVVHWGVRTLWHHGDSLVGVTVAALDFTAAALFLLRDEPLAEASYRDAAFCAGGVLVGGAALALSPAYGAWPRWAAGLFAVGAVLTVGSLLVLGRSFSVLPARRTLVRSGPFRWIRHPVYAGELAMLAACAGAGGVWWSWAVALGGLALVAVRIGVEERFLRQDPDYRAYAAAVRWRLVPGLW